MSLCYFEQSRFLEFALCNEKALEIAREINWYKEEGFCLNNLGIYYAKRCLYSKSLESFEKSLEIAQKNNDILIASECMTNIGIIYKEMGDYEKSLEMIFRAMKIDENMNDNEYLSIDSTNIGTIYRKKWLETNAKNDLDQAIYYFNKSYDYSKKMANNSIKIRFANNLGTIMNDIGDYEKAIQYILQGLLFAKNNDDREAMCYLENNLGISYSRQGKDEEALSYFRKAIDGASRLGISRVLGEAFLETAEIQKRKRAYADALKSYQFAIEVMEKSRAAIEDEDFKTSFWRSGRKLDVFHGEIDLLFRMGETMPEFRPEALAFNCMERAKARGFLDRIEIGRVSVVRRTEALMDEKSREIQTNLSRLFRTWFCEPTSVAERAALEKDIQKYEDAYEALRREARAHDPLFAGLRFPQIISAEDIPSRILGRDTAIVTYAVGREFAYGLAITRTKRRLFRLPPPDRLRELVARHLRAISDRENAAVGAGDELFHALLPPEIVDSCRKIVIVPDDILYYLPFETLRRSPDSPWLGTKVDISYAPSISSLAEIAERGKKRRTNSMDLLAVASPESPGAESTTPAPFSEWEADRIGQLYDPEKRLILKGTAASEDELKKIPLEDFEIIHFAAHGFIDEQRPTRSAIVLSSNPAFDEDGLFQAREIFETRLDASLVVLSTCRSAAGRLVRGEGLEGLNRAFLFAGASAVLTSLWLVDDEAAAHLMNRFHVHLKEGDSITAALRRAKTEMLESAEYSHPAYWAGFIVTGLGDQRPAARRPEWLVPTALACAVALAAVLILAGRRRRENE